VSPPPSDIPEPPGSAVLVVPEIRDYALINRELARLLDEGVRRVELSGVRGQRLIASGLKGPWEATVVVGGDAGPELARGLDAPGLTVVCRGGSADGLAQGLVRGRVAVEGDAGDGAGYGQRGGTILIRGDAGHRAGLMQRGGMLVVLGKVGRLAGERQDGGLLVARPARDGSDVGRGRRGGRLIRLDRPIPWPSADYAELEAAVLRLT